MKTKGILILTAILITIAMLTSCYLVGGETIAYTGIYHGAAVLTISNELIGGDIWYIRVISNTNGDTSDDLLGPNIIKSLAPDITITGVPSGAQFADCDLYFEFDNGDWTAQIGTFNFSLNDYIVTLTVSSVNQPFPRSIAPDPDTQVIEKDNMTLTIKKIAR